MTEFTPETSPPRRTDEPDSNKGLFALIFIGLFALLTIGALRFNQSFNALNDLTDTPTLANEPATLQNSLLNDIEGIVFTEDQLPEGGIVIPPGEAVTFQLGPNGTDEDATISVEIDEESAIITDKDGNITRQDGNGNIISTETETETETETPPQQ